MGRMSDLHIEMQESNMDRMDASGSIDDHQLPEDILLELEGLLSEISDPVQLRTLDRIGTEIKRLQEIIKQELITEYARSLVTVLAKIGCPM